MSSFKIIIPARFASSRLEGKLLEKIAGRSVLERSFRQAKKTHCQDIIIATDSEKIAQLAASFDANVFFSQTNHQSGTERIAEVAKQKNWLKDEIIINLQADEPFINPNDINQLAKFCYERNSEMATLCSKAKREYLAENNLVKVVLNQANQAIYFSRAAIPRLRDDFVQDAEMVELRDQNIFKHIGVYAFRASFLQKLVHYPISAIEKIESLEQLRALYYSHSIDVLEVEPAQFDFAIDDIEQLQAIKKITTERQCK